MDSKPLELQAETYIVHYLIKNGMIVTKPYCDKEGGDLLVVQNTSESSTPVVRVQCKGRNVKSGSSVTIPQRYVQYNFVCFLYAQENEQAEPQVYIFFQSDITLWATSGNEYKLSIPKNFRQKDYFKIREINPSKILRIKEIFAKKLQDKAPIQSNSKKNLSIVIDGIFLEKAVLQTKSIYREIYPEKALKKPSIDDIIYHIIRFTYSEKQSCANCYLFYSNHFNLESIVDIGDLEEFSLLMGEKPTLVGANYNLFKSKVDDIIFFRVQDQIDRIINTENIVLVADDFAYTPYLKSLQEIGLKIVVIQNSEDCGSQMHHCFKWLDIAYPIGLSMGLEHFEL